MPRPGDIVHIGAACGVPFNIRPVLLRVIRVLDPADSHHWAGMTWIDGYELNTLGDAVVRREVYVIAAGLLPVVPVAAPPTRNKPLNRAPVELPRQRATPAITTTGRTR